MVCLQAIVATYLRLLLFHHYFIVYVSFVTTVHQVILGWLNDTSMIINDNTTRFVLNFLKL